MMRRRAFFGGKKEPLYLFKEGVGFDSTKCSYVTNSASTVTVSSRYIDIHYNSRVEEGGVILIGNTDSSFVAASKFKWAQDFPGYHTLKIECLYFGASGLTRCGLSSKSIIGTPQVSDWISSKKPSRQSNREILEFDITGQADSTIGIWGECYDSSHYGYVYNIWLE